MRDKRRYVYITSSKSRVIYVGITGSLTARVLQRKAGDGGRPVIVKENQIPHG